MSQVLIRHLDFYQVAFTQYQKNAKKNIIDAEIIG